jgi:hypothetical protein
MGTYNCLPVYLETTDPFLVALETPNALASVRVPKFHFIQGLITHKHLENKTIYLPDRCCCLQ